MADTSPDATVGASPEPIAGVKRKYEHDSDDEDSEQVKIHTEEDRFGLETTDTPDASLFLERDDEKDLEPCEEDADADVKMDDADDDDDEDDQADFLYHETVEPLPKYPFYDLRVPELITRLTSLAEKVSSTLEPYASDSKRIKAHCIKSQELHQLPEPDKIRVAILGNAGTGKSSVTNSITDQPDLAKALSGGESCTCVPTEFSGPMPGQSTDYAASVEYFDMNETEHQLDEMFKDYCLYAFERDPHWDNDLDTTNKRSHEVASKMLRTLFNDLPRFSSESAMKDYMEKVHTGSRSNRTKALKELLEHHEKRMKSKITADLGYADYHAAATIAKLRKLVDPLMASNSRYKKPAFWPLVKRARFFIRGSRLLESVTLVDLPGISDTNRTRVQQTLEYIKSCKYIWTVAPISRVVDDNTVFQLLTKYSPTFKGNIWVIATHSDEGIAGHEQKIINYLEDEGCDMTAIQDIDRQFKAESKRFSASKQALKAAKTRKANREDIGRLRDELDTAQQSRTDVEQRRLALLVSVRSALIVSKLQAARRDSLPMSQALTVYCVSNYHYAALKGAKFRGVKLTAQQTGIPALRARALEISAVQRWKELRHFSDYHLKVLFSDLALWMSKTPIEHRDELLALFRSPQDKIKTLITERMALFTKVSATLIAKPLKAAKPSMRESAKKMLAVRRNLFPSTIRAFIRKDGRHGMKALPKESWNEKFNMIFADTCSERWSQLDQSVQSQNQQLEQAVLQAVRAVREGLERWPAHALPREKLIHSLELQEKSIQKTFSDNADKNADRLRNLLIEITQDSDKNLFFRIIKPVYDKLNADKGNGVTKRNMEALEEFLSQDGKYSPWSQMEAETLRRLRRDDKQNVGQYLDKQIKTMLNRIYTTADELVEDKKVDDPAQLEARAAMGPVLPQLQKELKEMIQELNDIKKTYDVMVV